MHKIRNEYLLGVIIALLCLVLIYGVSLAGKVCGENTSHPSPSLLKTYGDALADMKMRNMPGIIIFHAKWCGPCKRMRKDTWNPLMEELQKKYVVYFVDVDVEKKVVQEWRKKDKDFIKSIPAYGILSPNGDIEKYGHGYRNQKTIMAWIDFKGCIILKMSSGAESGFIMNKEH